MNKPRQPAGAAANDWKQSRFFWRCVRTAITILLAVVPAATRDFGWLLWLALPFATASVWEFARAKNARSPALWAALGGLIIATCLRGVSVSLPPGKDAQNVAAQPAEAVASASVSKPKPRATTEAMFPPPPLENPCPAGTAICLSGGGDNHFDNNVIVAPHCIEAHSEQGDSFDANTCSTPGSSPPTLTRSGAPAPARPVAPEKQ